MKLHHVISIVLFANLVWAQNKGLLPELKIDSKNEELNEKKQLTSELMISRAEDKAIQSLSALLKKKRGTSQEPDLLYRLAELYMRKSKTGRFFDLHQDSKTLKLSSVPIPPQKGKDWIRKASGTYDELEKRFPQFSEMDGVLFNNAFARQLLGDLKGSEGLYKKLLQKFPNSPLIPDGLIALGELLYDQARFKEARESFENIERFQSHKVYSYGLYKLAWTLYNLKLSDQAIQKLVEVVEKNPTQAEVRGYNLRKEALRDLVVFVGDTMKANELYSFFKKVTRGDELGEAILNLSKLYESHSREKEMHIFLNEFLSEESQHAFRVKAHMALVSANETLKKREEVLKNLDEASKLCDQDSPWKARQSPEWAKETCANDFRKSSLEIAKKWWDIWLKNKAHQEFSKLTERSLRLVLRTDDPTAPDFKTRYALAELLFQQGSFDEASQHYEQVGKTSTDGIMTHDADYAALFSVQKSIEKEKSKTKSDRLKTLSLNYIQKHPKGVHSLPVQLQVALAEYEANHDQESEKYLKPLIAQNTNKTVRKKAQDLMLDILNLRKDFTSLKNLAAQFLKEADSPERSQSLQKIYEEAHYSEVQAQLSTKKKIEVADLLLEFRKTHPQSRLSKEALWQALSLAYADGFTTRGAELSRDFSKAYPDDKRSLEALKEAANSFLQVGRIEQALEVQLQLLKSLPENEKRKLQELIADLFVLQGKRAEGRQILKDMMKSASPSEKGNLQDRILQSFSASEKSGPEFKQYEQQLVSAGREPLATEFLTRQAVQALEKKQYSQAFQMATKIMGRDVAPEFRARARFVQARILEQELFSQGVKTTKEDRLSMVLNIKTEKLDKALTAYNSTAKMSKDPQLILEILEALDRCYGNYVESLRTMELPSTLSESDRQGLKVEIEKIVTPISEKQTQNREAILQLRKKTPGSESQIQWADLAPNEGPPLPSVGPDSSNVKAYLPEDWKPQAKPWEGSKPKCSQEAFKKDSDFSNRAELMAGCYFSQNWKVFESEALALTDTPTHRAWGLFYLSLQAEKSGLFEKGLWLMEKALALETQEVFHFQKARLVALLEGLNGSLADFLAVASSEKLDTPDLMALQAFHDFQTESWQKSWANLSKFSKDQLNSYHLVFVTAEVQRRLGSLEDSVKTVLASSMKNSIEAWLYLGRHYESHQPDLIKAQDSYKKALGLSQNPEQKNWIERKLQYLGSLKKTP